MSPDYFLQAFDYCKEEGALYWAPSRPMTHFSSEAAYKTYLGRFAGKRAGCAVRVGNTYYRQVRLNGTLYTEHQIVWCIEYGQIPDLIDHKDGDGLNNSITNLKSSDKVGNGKNCKIKSNNTSGVTGVYWHKVNSNWVAEGHYTDGGKKRKKSLGSYTNIEDAAKARKIWEQEQGYTDRHGK